MSFNCRDVILPSVVAISIFWTSALLGADWPTYQRDAARSGVSSDSLEIPLRMSWSWKSPVPPQMAWPGPARADLYNKVYQMKDRMVFDRVFHPIVAGGRLYFGSSATDQVHCLDVATGKPQWSVFCEGPVRFAPTAHAGRIFFGSDDGCVYCAAGDDGTLLWRKRLAVDDTRLPGNGRVISKWPVRTSVVEQEGMLYACCGMFPAEGVYLVAMTSEDGNEIWRTKIPNLPAQGYLLASATRIYVPSGRNNPIVFDRGTGELLRVVAGMGGTYCLLTGDTLLFGPGKTGQLGVVERDQKDQLATFSGNRMIVTPQMSYLHRETTLAAVDRTRYLDLARRLRTLSDEQVKATAEKKNAEKQSEAAKVASLNKEIDGIKREQKSVRQQMDQCQPWSVSCSHPYSIVLGGDSIVAGGDGSVAVYDANSGAMTWQHKVEGRAYGLAIANGRLVVSTDKGVIHCFESTRAEDS